MACITRTPQDSEGEDHSYLPPEVFALTWHADVGNIMHMVPCIACFIHQICHLLILDMLACGPWHGSIDGVVQPSFGINNSRPSRGAKHREADDTKASLGDILPRLAPEEHR